MPQRCCSRLAAGTENSLAVAAQARNARQLFFVLAAWLKGSNLERLLDSKLHQMEVISNRKIRQPTATIAPAIRSRRGNEALIFAGNRPCQSLVTSAATFLTSSRRASVNRQNLLSPSAHPPHIPQ